MASTSSAAAGGRKRKRSAFGCVHEGNDVLVEDLQALRQRVRESSHLASNYGRAISSIRAYPTPVRSASEAKKLKNIGNYLANQIHSILRKRQLLGSADAASDAPPPAPVAPVEPPQAASLATITTERPPREYAPAYRKQPWFVLLALQQAQAMDETAAVSTDALFWRIQDAGYDGSSGKLKTCLASLCGTHEVVKRTSQGLIYLTEKGRRSATLCPGSLTASVTSSAPSGGPGIDSQTAEPPREAPSQPGVVCIELSDDDDDDRTVASSAELMAEPEPELGPSPVDLVRETDTWELVLLLDHREILERRNPRVLERKLLERNVVCEVCALSVGDVQWVARRRRLGGDRQDFVLNVIVERKEVHDLSGSIIDRRYFEQKTRLVAVREACGHMHVIYLVEGSLTQQTTVRASGLHTAMGRTQVQSDFFVQLCHNADETVAFLARVHARLLAKFPSNPRAPRLASSHLLSSSTDDNEFLRLFCRPALTFAAFNAQFRKQTQFTVREMYQKMLMQAPGLSAAKTVGLSAKYQNFHELESALRQHGRESEVEHVRCGKTQRRFGLKARKALGELLTATDYVDEDA